MRACFACCSLLFGASSMAIHAEDPVAALGREKAAASRIQWEIREAGHPSLGPIRFALTRTPLVSSVGSSKLYSRVYISCETNARTIAIELTNQVAPDDPGGLKPAAMPRLVCISPAEASGAQTVQEVLEARWQVNELGDAMARGFRPGTLRACSAIGIVQDVVLPKGWARERAPVTFEITPYATEVDAVFATCEGSAHATAAAPVAPPVAAPPRSPRPAPAAARSPAPVADAAWKTARTVAEGKTNLRAAPNIRARVVVRLPPDVAVLAQRAGGNWWHVKSRGGAKFEGYVRDDRLVVP